MNLTTGTSLRNGKYEIAAVVGQGCFETTYRATHISSKQTVLIQALNENWRGHPQFNLFQRRFVERVRQVAKCRHPHLMRIFDLFAENGFVYAVTEEIPGVRLSELLSEGKPMSLRSALKLIRQVASALRLLHQHDVLHLNIKPDSIIQRHSSDRFVLTDFGIAHHLTLGARQTQAGMLSAGYAAPEQYDPQIPPTPATDVYGLAAILYHLLTGQPPISASLRSRIPLLNLPELHPEITPALEGAILRGLEPSLDERTPSIEAWMNPLWREFFALETTLNEVKLLPVQSPPRLEAETETDDETDVPMVQEAVVDRFYPDVRVEPSLPPQLQPWIPALFAATSIIAGIGGASFVLARQSSVATAPTPEFSRLQETFPSRSTQENFSPDQAFAEAADPDETSVAIDRRTSSPVVPSEETHSEIEKAEESTPLPEENTPEAVSSFPLEVESWESQETIHTTEMNPELDSEPQPVIEEASTPEYLEEELHQESPPPLEPETIDPDVEVSDIEPELSPPPMEIPESPTYYPEKPALDTYIVPKPAIEFSGPKESKT